MKGLLMYSYRQEPARFYPEYCVLQYGLYLLLTSFTMNIWEFISMENGISVYKNTETWQIDVIDCYEPE